MHKSGYNPEETNQQSTLEIYQVLRAEETANRTANCNRTKRQKKK
jgi:hypothetical protein